MTGHRQPWYLDRLRAELERVAAIEDRRERGPALGRLRPALGRLRPWPQTLVALALVAALVAVVVTVAREPDVERPAAPPGKKVAATDVENGVRFSLDGRVLTVQLLPIRPNATFEAVSGAEISATCRTNIAAPPGDPRSQSTVFRIWPAGETSLSYRFPRDVSSCAGSTDSSVGIVASVSFPVACRGRGGRSPRPPTSGRGTSPQPSDLHRLHEPNLLRGDEGANGQGMPIPACRGGRRDGGERDSSARRPRESPLGGTERPQRSPTTSDHVRCDVARGASG